MKCCGARHFDNFEKNSYFETIFSRKSRIKIFCVWNRRYDISHVKNDENSPKHQQIYFCFFQKFAQFFCIFTNFGSWLTFSVPNEFV